MCVNSVTSDLFTFDISKKLPNVEWVPLTDGENPSKRLFLTAESKSKRVTRAAQDDDTHQYFRYYNDSSSLPAHIVAPDAGMGGLCLTTGGKCAQDA